MASLGGGGIAGGSPSGQHQRWSVNERMHRILPPARGTRAFPIDEGWFFREDESSPARAYKFGLDEKKCFKWELVVDADGCSGLEENPEEKSRTVWVNTPRVDFAESTELDPITGLWRLAKRSITPDDFACLIHAVAVVTPHANWEVLCGVKKDLVPIWSEDTIVSYFTGTLPPGQRHFKFPILRPKRKGGRGRSGKAKPEVELGADGKPKMVARDIIKKEADQADYWVRNQQDEDQRQAPGYDPSLAALGLSYLQSSRFCTVRLAKLVRDGYIRRVGPSWYALAKLPASGYQDGVFKHRCPTSPIKHDGDAPSQTSSSAATADSPSTWRTTPSITGYSSPDLKPETSQPQMLTTPVAFDLPAVANWPDPFSNGFESTYGSTGSQPPSAFPHEMPSLTFDPAAAGGERGLGLIGFEEMNASASDTSSDAVVPPATSPAGGGDNSGLSLVGRALQASKALSTLDAIDLFKSSAGPSPPTCDDPASPALWSWYKEARPLAALEYASQVRRLQHIAA